MKIDNWSTVDSALEALRDNDKADVEHYIRELGRENAKLRKDKERLDYLLREYNLYRFGYEERLDRADIDKATKEEA